MRGAVFVVLLALAACGPQADDPTPSAPVAVDATTALPAGFPADDLAQRAAECVVYVRLAGAETPDLAARWEASLTIDQGYSVEEANQLIASSVNPLSATPEAQRDAAAAWCAANMPDPQP